MATATAPIPTTAIQKKIYVKPIPIVINQTTHIKKFNKEKTLDILLTNIEELQLDQKEKFVVYSRFLTLVHTYKRQSLKYEHLYNATRVIITLGSISIPSLLSIQNFINISISFWIVWIISLVVSILNAYVSLFKIDKNYYSFTALYEQMKSEFWQYKSLCGRYSGFYTPNSQPTHKNQYTFFMNNIERVQMRSIEETYIKVSDNPKEKKESDPNSTVPSVKRNDVESPSEEMTKKISESKKANY